MSADIKMTDKTLQSILAPQITEKATMVADKYNQVTFKVLKMQLRLMLKQRLK